MKFTSNVKPLKDALDLCVISSNISKFFEKSTVIELTVDSSSLLRLNTQATSLLSEVILRGSSEGEGTNSAIVDCTLFKSLIATLDTDTVTFDFQEGILVVESGKSKFSVPVLFTSEDDATLDRPANEDSVQGKHCTDLNPSNWKYIQDHQLYSLALSQIRRVYTRVWISKDKGVLTGDPQTSIFTFASRNCLTSTCLVTATVVNLLAALDEETKLYSVNDDNYVAIMNTDAFTFISQFTVDREDENGIGVYDSNMVFDMIFDDSQPEVKVSRSKLVANIKQAALFVSASNPIIAIKATDNGIYLVNDNVNCRIAATNDGMNYDSQFTVTDLNLVVSHTDGDDLTVSPIVKDDEVIGIRFTSGDMISLLGGVE